VTPVCPKCGGEVRYDFTCHTWQGHDGAWMGCVSCDSAIRYYCRKSFCWDYTHGLNSHNPRWEKNELNRPDWLPPGPPTCDKLGILDTYPGVKWIGEEDDKEGESL